MRLRLLAAGALVLTAAVPPALGQTGSGIRELVVPAGVDYTAADGGRIAFDQYVGLNCDAITIWSPLAGTRVRIKKTGFCDDDSGETTDLALAGPRLLWQDGWSANSYSNYSVFTLDTSKSLDGNKEAPDLFDYEYTHDDYAREDYGPTAGPFAGHGSLLVFATDYEPKNGPVRNARLWRIDGGRKTLIRRGLDFVALSVDRNRIAGSASDGPVYLLGADGHTIRTFRPPLRRIRVVTLQGDDLAAAGGGHVVVFDTRSGHVKASRTLPGESRFQDYANGLATLIHGNSIHVLRLSDGRDVVVARPQGKGVQGESVASEIEPQGLYYTYTTSTSCCHTGHVVFVPWKTLQRLLR
ncbi:MAG TPA: hypothetical protein VLJ76_03180 [Gaiellaceae bacterium]|nr:hypothetical protein [Gaiellaceae bacterium]